MKNEVAVFTTNDLQAAGINSQLTSNDLLEVVAHDIYDKFQKSVDEVIENGKKLSVKCSQIFDTEIEQMKNELIKNKHLTAKEETTVGFGSPKNVYWGNSIYINKLRYEEVSAGTRVKRDSDSFSYPPTKNSKVRLYVQVNNNEKEEAVLLNGIKGTIETRINKSFYKEIVPSESKIKILLAEIKIHNEQVEFVFDFLPQNRILSVERFTREARVKMNKKIISAQSPEFRKKISELFSIKL